MDALIAQGWFDSVYGSGSRRRNQILTELDKAEKALEAAKKKQKEHPSPANQLAVERAQARINRAIGGHATLPEEDDAFVAGERSEPGVTRDAPPKPVPVPGGGGPPGAAPAPAPTPAGPVPAPAGHGALPVLPTKLRRVAGCARGPRPRQGLLSLAPEPAAVLELIRRLLDEVGRAGATAAAVADAAGGDVVDSGAPLSVEVRSRVPGVGAVTITRRWESETPNSGSPATAMRACGAPCSPGAEHGRPSCCRSTAADGCGGRLA